MGRSFHLLEGFANGSPLVLHLYETCWFFFEILAPFEITLHLARNPLNLSFFKCIFKGFFFK